MRYGKDQSKRVKITTFPMRVLVYRSEQYPGWWIVKCMITARCSRTGKPDSFSQTWRIKFGKSGKYNGPPSRERLHRWVRKIALRQLTHELDEGLLIDGKRLKDPHRKKKWKRKS